MFYVADSFKQVHNVCGLYAPHYIPLHFMSVLLLSLLLGDPPSPPTAMTPSCPEDSHSTSQHDSPSAGTYMLFSLFSILFSGLGSVEVDTDVPFRAEYSTVICSKHSDHCASALASLVMVKDSANLCSQA